MDNKLSTEKEIFLILEKISEDLANMDQKINILRDKLQAACILLGDLNDDPEGSLRQRISAIEKLLLDGVTFADKIKSKFTPPNQNQLLLRFHS